MKLQIAFDHLDLDQALNSAASVHEYADILEIGSVLIYTYGERAVREFRTAFPHKVILVDTKIVDRGKHVAAIFAQAGADWVTVMAGIPRGVIHTASSAAHELGKKVALDLADASSLGQAALEAKSVGADTLLLHKPSSEDDSQVSFLDKWEMVRGNTQLPIFISANPTRDTIHEIIALNPAGIILGKSIFTEDNPAAEAEFYHSVIHGA